jgi:hypothetical protein
MRIKSMTQQQNNRIIKYGILLGFIFSILYILALFYIIPPYSNSLSFAQRMVLAIECSIFPGIMLLLGILVIGKARFGNESDDPTKHEYANQAMKVNLRYLSNTHEQFTLFVINVLGLAIFIPDAYLTFLPIYSSLFVIGRITFWTGYRIHPLYRASGFGMCFYPAIIGMLYNGYSVLLEIFI